MLQKLVQISYKHIVINDDINEMEKEGVLKLYP